MAGGKSEMGPRWLAEYCLRLGVGIMLNIIFNVSAVHKSCDKRPLRRADAPPARFGQSAAFCMQRRAAPGQSTTPLRTARCPAPRHFA